MALDGPDEAVGRVVGLQTVVNDEGSDNGVEQILGALPVPGAEDGHVVVFSAQFVDVVGLVDLAGFVASGAIDHTCN